MKTLYHPVASCYLKIITLILFCLPVTINAQEFMRANLYVVDTNGVTLVDGNLTNYNNAYSNAVDINDAWKIANPGINFGILRDGYNLVVERRSIICVADTTFFRMWNMPQLNYRIRFVLKNLNHPNLKAFLKDNYLNIEFQLGLNDTSYYNFTIDANPASADQIRFKLIFGTNSFSPVDVNFTGIQAQRMGKDVMVSWGVANELSMESYAIEHSTDGRNFHKLQLQQPINSPVFKTYKYQHIDAPAGENFYRIKGLSIGGRVQYSPIVKINSIAPEQDITVYPNPVINKTVQLQFNNQPSGSYNIELIYGNGTRKPLPTMQISSGLYSCSVNLPQNLAAGIYKLQISGADNKRIVRNILVL